MEYNSAMKRNEILLFEATWLDVEGIMLSEINQRKINTVWYHLYVESTSCITTLWWQRGLINSTKLWAMLCRDTQDWRVIVKSSVKSWSTGWGNGKPLQYSCCKNPMNSRNRQKVMTPEDEPPQSQKVSNMLLGKSGGKLLIVPKRVECLGQSGNDAQLWICLVVKAKSNAVKNNIA